ncbi:hypothetical protein DFQ30_008491 [Apophysomyces sp. BC1015]|nr:hypothetical protein DFQ30_008491 [Apophysomyces sp. BC1015]
MDLPTHNPQNAQQQLLQRQAMNRSSFYMLLFLLSLLFLNFSDDETARAGKPTIDEMLKSLQYEKEILHNVTFGVNVTHPLPSSIASQIQEITAIGQSNPASHYYHNVTGVFRGDWESKNIEFTEPEHLNKTTRDEARGSFRFDGIGSFTLHLKSIATKNENVNFIEGYMRLKDADKSDYGVLLLAEGVHFLSNGTIYLMGVPDSVPLPLEDLLHMLPSNQSMLETNDAITEQINKRIEELEKLATWGGQQIAESGELENPQGITTIRPPPLEISSVMFSPNCGLAMSINEATGIKIEKYYSKAISYASMATVIAIVQIFALIHQMEYTPTPSSISNVSYWTIAMQAMMDGYICLLHLTTGVVIDTVFTPFAAAAFFSFVLVSVFGMRYLLVVWRIQRPEATILSRLRPARPPENGTENNTTNTSNTRNILPVSTTPAPSNSHRDVSLLYYRLYAMLLFGLFLFYQTATRSALIQNIILGLLGFVFYSFWVPQIIRSVLRGCRRPLSPRYVVAMSITRLIIPLYFCACPHNVLSREPTRWIWVLVAYVAFQVMILFLQDIWGPRFFVPERYLPQTYNYHPVLPPEDEESPQGERSDRDAGAQRAPKECPVCMLPIDLFPSGHTGLHVLGRIQYMVTPCHHHFHTDCLEKVIGFGF